METDRLNGVALHWERSGRGDPLLFCNGSGATIDTARPLLALLTESFDVLAWDYRGLGGSVPLKAAYGMTDLAADAVALLDRVGWERPRVLGVSFGGMVALALAVAHPSRVARLALLCTSAGGAGGSSYPLQDLLALPADEAVARRLAITDTRWDAEWLSAHRGDRVLAEMLAEREGDPPDPRARRAQLDARAGHDVWGRLGAIDCPTLVACGRFDGIAPPANSAALASRIDGARMREYEGGHMFMWQDGSAMPEILGFLRDG